MVILVHRTHCIRFVPWRGAEPAVRHACTRSAHRSSAEISFDVLTLPEQPVQSRSVHLSVQHPQSIKA